MIPKPPYSLSDTAPPITRPPSERYRKLVLDLIAVDVQLAADVDTLKASIDALHAVNTFLGADDHLRAAGVSTALRRLLATLDDVVAGAKPTMIFDRQKSGNGKPGRPTGLSFENCRAFLVHALNGLIKAGMTNDQAARRIEKLLSQEKVRTRGKAIEAKKLLQWREQIGDTSPAQVDQMVRMIEDLRKLSGLPSNSLELASQEAEGFVKLAARWNSN